MTNIRQLSNRHAVRQEAADWLIRLDGDIKPDAQELDELREWLARSPVHSEELNRLNNFWANNILTELMVPFDRGVRRPGLFAGIGTFLRAPRRAVSAFAVALVCMLVLLNLWNTSTNMMQSNGLYMTAVGQQKTLDLPDGSTIVLNTDSQLKVDYTNRHRNIRLMKGEAYFDVAKNPDQPFRVYAGGGRVQAVGTAFNVYLQDDGLNVFVTEGSVALASLRVSKDLRQRPQLARNQQGSSRIDDYVNTQSEELGVLDAGQAVTLGKELNSAEAIETVRQTLIESVNTMDERELKRRQSWRDGLLVFSGETLEQVVEEISRYTTVSIEITDPQVRQIQIGGRFKAGDLDNMFMALEANFGLEVNRLSYHRAQLTLAE